MNEFDDAALAVGDDAGLPDGQGGAEAMDPVLAEAPRAPRKTTFQERIDEMTRARRDAERERDYWREQAAMAPPAAHDMPQHDLHDAESLRALARQEAQQALQQAMMEQAAASAEAQVQQAWEGRQAQFVRERPDYQEVFDRDWACSPAMAEAIRTSDDGPAVAYHLALNPDLARHIFGLSPLAQAREMGRIEAALSRGQPLSHNAAVSNAPAPPPQARGSGARMRVSPDTDDFASFDRAY
jgi:hypothetical protein